MSPVYVDVSATVGRGGAGLGTESDGSEVIKCGCLLSAWLHKPLLL